MSNIRPQFHIQDCIFLEENNHSTEMVLSDISFFFFSSDHFTHDLVIKSKRKQKYLLEHYTAQLGNTIIRERVCVCERERERERGRIEEETGTVDRLTEGETDRMTDRQRKRERERERERDKEIYR